MNPPESVGARGVQVQPPPWWAHPVVGLCIFALPGVVLAVMLPARQFLDAWGVTKHIRTEHVLVAVGAVVGFAAGAAWFHMVRGSGSIGRVPVVSTDRLLRTYHVLVGVALLGYAAWGAIAVVRGVRPGDLQAVLRGEPLASYSLKQLMAPVAGVTTLTQVAPLVGGIVGILAARGRLSQVTRTAGLLVLLAVLRAYFLSERLAILEIAVPGIVTYLMAVGPDSGRSMTRIWRRWFPAIYLLGAAAVFIAFEFNRSWAYYRLRSDGGYLEFAVERFAGYYATAPNNAALLADGILGARPQLFSVQWLVDFPVLGGLTGLGDGRMPMNELLIGVANPEFNTEGALLAPSIDFGAAPSFFVWFLLGVAAMVLYRQVRSGGVAWLPLYASVYVGILESGRYFYWGLGRAFVPIVAGLVVARYLSSDPTPADVEGPGGAGAPAAVVVGAD